MTTAALRCMDKAGGFDNYILTTKDKWLGEGLAQKFKKVFFFFICCICWRSYQCGAQVLIGAERSISQEA